MRNKVLERFYIILKIIESVRYSVGKTFIQKAIYILKEGFGLTLDYEFKLHFFGPYSERISTDIDILENGGLIEVKYDEETGYKISITSKGIKFIEDYSSSIENLKEIQDKITKTLSLSKNKTAREMELLGTTLYFLKLTKDENRLLNLVKMTKPHFQPKEIKKAIEKLKSIN
ncbi:MAG: hypothetical protein N3A00_04245 [Thermodesulfovibrio sp.]|nr:hypothetical protein [Thermodesulfovibrio sp.]